MKQVPPDKYMPMVISKAHRTWKTFPIQWKIRIELEDLIHDAALFVSKRVIPRFKKNRGVRWSTYLWRCLDNFFISWRQRIFKRPLQLELSSEIVRGLRVASREREILAADSYTKLYIKSSRELRRFLRQYVVSRRVHIPKKFIGELSFLSYALGIGPEDFILWRRTDVWKCFTPNIWGDDNRLAV
jgi:hypothetical protein